VTIRDRDSRRQIRLDIGKVVEFAAEIKSGVPFDEASKRLGGIPFKA
jgi:glycyl-tRNA synthetase (EC 6.1.1.14)